MEKKDFMKSILKLSFWQLTIFSIWQMIVFTITGNEAATLIQWFFTFWGVEVALLMLKKIVDKKINSTNHDYVPDEEPENYEDME